MFIKLGFTLFLPTFFPWLLISIYLSFKLKKNRFEMIEGISASAPKKFQSRAKLMMTSNFSWVFASSSAYVWYVYLMLRLVWKIPRHEILEWRISIGKLFGKYETLYRVFSYLVNVSMIGFTMLVVFLLLER